MWKAAFIDTQQVLKRVVNPYKSDILVELLCYGFILCGGGEWLSGLSGWL